MATLWFPLVLCFLFFVPLAAPARLASWDLSTANPTTASTFAVTSTNGVQSASALTFGNGLTPINAAGWKFTGWSTTGTNGANQFIAFDITPIPGQPVEVDRVNLFSNIGTTPSNGPTLWVLEVSSSSNFATITQTINNTVPTGTSSQQIDLNPKITATSTLYFRTYGLFSTAAGASGGLENGGGGSDVGVVIEGSKRVQTCACVSSSCAGTGRIYDQNSCVQLRDPCTGVGTGIYGIITAPTSSSWSVAQFVDVNCTIANGTITSNCGLCSSGGLLFDCSTTCPTSSGSSAGMMANWVHAWLALRQD